MGLGIFELEYILKPMSQIIIFHLLYRHSQVTVNNVGKKTRKLDAKKDIIYVQGVQKELAFGRNKRQMEGAQNRSPKACHFDLQIILG